MPTPLFPVFLKLDGVSVVVVGGGPIAAGKLDGLHTAGAKVTVVAPKIVHAIRVQAGPRVRLVERSFQQADLDHAQWVVAAAPPDVNQQVAAAAAARGLFVNAVDDTSAATAYLGGVIRRGDVEVAISTGGTAPALAGLLKEALEALLPAELDRWIEVAQRARADWKRSGTRISSRRSLLLRALVQLHRADVLPLERGAA